VSEEDPKVCPKCGGKDLIQDTDVLDTWFSSALWPFSTLGWPEVLDDLKTFYPTSVLITGYDIITFWVSRMIMMGLKFMREVPFETVYIHGLVRDVHGKKMSKSLGNVIDPINVIDKVGADALRFALISLVTGQGQDIKLSEEKITECRNFANKIWNASRFVLMNLDGEKGEPLKEEDLDFSDKWILSRYNHVILRVTSLIEDYDFGEAARVLYEFLWGEFCDWYVEISKEKLYSKDEELKTNAQAVLVHVLEGTLRLLHPFMPFITEEIRQKLISEKEQERSIMPCSWPKAEEKFISKDIDVQMRLIMDVVKSIRNTRAELNIPHSKRPDVVLAVRQDSKRDVIGTAQKYIKELAGLGEVDIKGKLTKKPENTATSVVSGIEIYIPLKGLIDIKKEKERLKRELGKLDLELERIKKKFQNKKFVKNAKPEVIEKERNKEAEYLDKKKIIAKRLKSLK